MGTDERKYLLVPDAHLQAMRDAFTSLNVLQMSLLDAYAARDYSHSTASMLALLEADKAMKCLTAWNLIHEEVWKEAPHGPHRPG